MATKNTDVMHQIETMLHTLKESDYQQYTIIRSLLQEVFVEYSTGKSRNIERKLYDLIDAEVTFKLKNEKK
jgi:hypothetical protein